MSANYDSSGGDASDREAEAGGASGRTETSASVLSQQDNEYYNFLNVSRMATEAEVVAAYKKLTRLYHPDKHLDPEKKKKAEVMFAKLKKAHEVLSNPHQRAIYDCLGKEGLEEKGWEIVQRTKTPREIREEYEQLARDRADRKLQMRTNPTSRLQMTVNATDLFDRYLYDAEFDDVIDETGALPRIEVSEISFGQTIDCPITNSDNVVLSGNVSTRNGNGDGSVGVAWKRVTSDRNWFELEGGFGNGPRAGAKYFRALTSQTFVNMSGSMQLTHRGGLKPSFSISFGNQMGAHSVGYLTYSSNWNLDETSDQFIFSEESSGMATMLVYNTERLRMVASLQFGVPHTYFLLSATKKWDDDPGESRIRGSLSMRGSVRAGTFGAVCEYGVERRVTAHSTLGATMSFGIPIGVRLKIKVTRAQQTYIFPLHLSDELLMQPLFYGTVAPLLIYFTVKKLILDPLEARKKKADKAKKYESVRARVAEARKEAMASIDLMKERFNRIRQDEMTKGGLVVVAAIYGKLINEFGDDVFSLDDIPLPLLSGGGAVEDYHSSDGGAIALQQLLAGHPEVIDVTIPLQCLVEENSRMSLYKASKCDLAGFYDPAPTDEDKQLVVRYAYQGRLHQVSVGDLEGLKLPRNAHREQQTQTT